MLFPSLVVSLEIKHGCIANGMRKIHRKIVDVNRVDFVKSRLELASPPASSHNLAALLLQYQSFLEVLRQFLLDNAIGGVLTLDGQLVQVVQPMLIDHQLLLLADCLLLEDFLVGSFREHRPG